MQFFVNERFLPIGQRLKVLVLAPELRSPGDKPTDIGARLRIQGEGESQGWIEMQRPFDIFTDSSRLIYGGSPFSYGEYNTAKLAPGSYFVETYIGSTTVSRIPFAVLADDHQKELLSSVSSEHLVRKSLFEDDFQVSKTWQQAWTQVFAYLGIPTPQHIRFGFEKLKLTRGEVGLLSVEAIDWIAFHINRFIFDQVFYGGHILMQKGDREERLEFKLIVNSLITPLDGKIPESLVYLARSLEQDNHEVNLEWKVKGQLVGDLTLRWS